MKVNILSLVVVSVQMYYSKMHDDPNFFNYQIAKSCMKTTEICGAHLDYVVVSARAEKDALVKVGGPTSGVASACANRRRH